MTEEVQGLHDQQKARLPTLKTMPPFKMPSHGNHQQGLAGGASCEKP